MDDADWMMENIIDDYAKSLDAPKRVTYYRKLAQLLAERCTVAGLPVEEQESTDSVC